LERYECYHVDVEPFLLVSFENSPEISNLCLGIIGIRWFISFEKLQYSGYQKGNLECNGDPEVKVRLKAG